MSGDPREPLELVARKILAAFPDDPDEGVRAMQAKWHAFDAALWRACRKGDAFPTLPVEIAEKCARIDAAEPSRYVRDEILATLMNGYLSGDGLALRDVASGTYFKSYMPGEGDVCVDAGAHCGYLTAQLAQLVGVSGFVLAFEPNQRNFIKLLQTKRGGIEPFFMALWHEAAVLKLVPTLGSATHRIGSFGQPIVARPLDYFNLPRLDFLKIDVEGSELQVVQGAEQTINRCRPHMVVETEGGTQTGDKLRAGLEEINYEVVVEMADENVGMLYATPQEKKR